MLVFKHYFYRMIKHPLNIGVYWVLPAIIIALNITIMDFNMEGTLHIVDGFNLISSGIVIQIVVMFQLFATSLVYDLLYADFRTDRRWRLLAAPRSLGHYLRANLFAAMIISVISGMIVLTVGRVVFNAYIFNIPVVLATLFVLSAFSMAIGTIIFLTTTKKSAAEGLAHAVVWPQFIPLMMGLATEGPMFFIFQRATPAALGMNAIALSSGFGEHIPGIGSGITDYDMTRSLTYLAILAGLTAVAWVITIILGKAKKF